MAQKKIVVSARGLGEIAVRMLTASGEVADEEQARRILRNNPFVADRYRRMAVAAVEASENLDTVPGALTVRDPWVSVITGPEDLSRMPKDDGLVWTTATGRTITWDGDHADWHVSAYDGEYTNHWTPGALSSALARTEYPIHCDQF